MTTYYVDPAAGSNTAPYDTWAKAALTIKTIIALPPAFSDVIYCRGHEHIAAEVDLASSGTNAGGWIKVIGCNAAGEVDGTRYVINGDGAGINIFDFAGYDMWWLENIEATNTGAGAFAGFYSSAASAYGHVFVNCCANNCGGVGFLGSNFLSPVTIKCVAYTNTSHGFTLASSQLAAFCASRDNGAAGSGSGFNNGKLMWGCIAHGNSDDGFIGGDTGTPIFYLNCVGDSNGDDGLSVAGSSGLYPISVILGSRFTNQSGAGDNGIFSADPCIIGWSYFEDNTDNINDHTSVLIQQVVDVAVNPYTAGVDTPVDTNEEDGADTNEGYKEAVANHNFATNYVDGTDPTLRRVAITIPWS